MALDAAAKPMAFIITRDRARAKSFYGEVLGFPLTHEDTFAAVFDIHGVSMRVTTVSDFTPHGHTVLGWEVADIVANVEALKAKGIICNIYGGLGQDELGIWTAPGGGAKVAWFSDPDGNELSVTQY